MRLVPIAAMVTALVLASAAFAADIGSLAWNQANIATLRSLDKTGVEALVNQLRGDDPLHARVGDYEWADLAGDARYELVVTEDLSGRNFFDYLAVYTQGSSGKIIVQAWIEGFGIGELGNVIRDLNGDGRDELIIPTALISYTSADTVTWPAVYRLENGKYVEASRDFANFYDGQVLPELNQGIASARNEIRAGKGSKVVLATLQMERNKILRVLGRDPSAGLDHARQWMKSGDPKLLQDAAATFKDIGGHEEEANAAEASYRHALCERFPRMVMCNNLPGSGKPATP